MSNDAPFAAANARSRKKRIGSIGAGVRSSQATNAAVRIAPTASEPTICGLVQPSPFPWMRPQTSPSNPALTSARPGRSRPLSGPYVSRRNRRASGTSRIPIGTFSQKIHCQEIPSTTAPPTSGPEATARPAIPDHAPSASPRFSFGKASARIVSVSGVTIAPPIPWIARAAMRASMLGASAAATDAAVKRVRPMAKTRRRPKRSPSAAPVSSRTAKVRV